MPVLVGNQLTVFVHMLTVAEKKYDSLDSWHQKFVDNMRFHFDGREAEQDMGVTPWHPTKNQWNQLHTIANGKIDG
jgi:hypothetical protein